MAAKYGLSLFVVLLAAQVLTSSGSPSYYCGCPPAQPPPTCIPSAPSPPSCPITIPSTPIHYPPVSLPAPQPANYPLLPPLVSSNPLSIPLPLPSIIPVGKLCVCKPVHLQPSLVPVARPCKPAAPVCPPTGPVCPPTGPACPPAYPPSGPVYTLPAFCA